MRTSIIAALFSVAGLAGVANAKECHFVDSVKVTTQNRHCDSDCKRWADEQAILPLRKSMPRTWAAKGAYYDQLKVRCEGGNGCRFVELGGPTTEGGTMMSVTFKTWSISVTIVLEGRICTP